MTSRTVLIVDDDYGVREVVSMAVEDMGYTPITAENGKDALIRLASYKPDLIVSDIKMPILDGYGLYHRIQQHPDYRHIPFVVLTSFASQVIHANNVHPVAILPKPFDMGVFIEVIEQVLEND
ncbi:MAG: response regulator [Chloroflexaceae bacterium]|nr:response regulator [Chloroflexaceae bacterium]NJL33762.1 response regulator [Chloroflexaceae bacterium]NJO05150.1 response regulator [Chloroflexaceae bacterium]NJO84940.1 response regulator [Blastochloris sp.]